MKTEHTPLPQVSSDQVTLAFLQRLKRDIDLQIAALVAHMPVQPAPRKKMSPKAWDPRPTLKAMERKR